MSSPNQYMDNPHDEVHVALLTRIVNNMKTLNESVHDVNLTINDINSKNKDIEVLAQMWQQYAKNIEYNLEATGQTREPI